MGTTTITYRFLFRDGRTLAHDVVLEEETGRQVTSPALNGQSWTQLERKQCKHCPLNKEDYPECPVAKNLAVVAHAFKSERSFEKVVVEVDTPERTCRKTAPLKDGLFSLFGLIMATSDCPTMTFLRPMARFHLPFSSWKETAVRSVAFYLMKQYFVARKGGMPDFTLTELPKLYEAVEEVNRRMADRIRSMSESDAEANSIVILDTFAQILTNQLGKGLQHFDELFA